MSAITGIYQYNGDNTGLQEQGFGLMKALEKYPADDIKVWSNKDVFLGCHSQWITPESVGEQLPYADNERKLTITADAIIDNRRELFEKLQVEYSRRKGIPDSELILLSYAKWGEDSPKYLIGEFAFMIWDERKQLLFGARDFSGSRTLYYHYNTDNFSFCTMIQPLLKLPYIKKELNENWIAEYLANPGVIETVDDSSTVYKEIKQVPASHSISILPNSKIVLRRYVKVTQTERLELKSNKEYEEAFLEVFQNAVNSRLRTFRSVGATLSGGLDSGSVVSLASRALQKENKRLNTYSFIPVSDYKDWTPTNRVADESPYIKTIVNHVGNIDDYYLDFNERSPFSEIDDGIELLEMPYKVFGNLFWINAINERASQQGVGILLSGARGNSSVSWGPPISYYAMLLKRMRWVNLLREIKLYSINSGAGKRRILKEVVSKAYPLLKKLRSIENQYKYPSLVNPNLAKRTNIIKWLQGHDIQLSGFQSPNNVYEARRKHFEETYTWNLNGTFGTKISLKYGVWNRDPTNDFSLIKFCLSVPEEQYVQNGMDRALIRRSTKYLLPNEVRLNQRNRGVQGADGIHRMRPVWNKFIIELEQICKDSYMSELINVPVVQQAISAVRGDPRPEMLFDADYCVLMRSLVLHRFLKKSH